MPARGNGHVTGAEDGHGAFDGHADAALTGFAGSDQPDPDVLRRCIRCGLCLPTCPTYVLTQSESSSPRGRIHLIASVAAGTLGVTDTTFVDQMYECLDCRACEDVCPSGVRYGQLIETARAQIERARRRPARQRMLRAAALGGLFADMRRVRLATRGLRWYQRSGVRSVVRASGVLARLGLAQSERMLPDLPAAQTTPNGQEYAPLASALHERVALFAGCVMSTVFPDTNRATIRVLALNGCAVVVPAAQQCCGALAVHAGSLDQARALARQNIAAFEASGATAVIVNAAGCGSALKEYGRLLEADVLWAQRATTFAGKVHDIAEWLGARHQAGTLNTSLHALPWHVTYQEPCHLAHAQGITQQPRQLLRAIPELELVEMAESKLCCGSAGVYNLTHPAMADQLAARKLANIVATGAEVVVTANPGCYLQLRASLLRAGQHIRVMHLVDLLDVAYRGIGQLSQP